MQPLQGNSKPCCTKSQDLDIILQWMPMFFGGFMWAQQQGMFNSEHPPYPQKIFYHEGTSINTQQTRGFHVSQGELFIDARWTTSGALWQRLKAWCVASRHRRRSELALGPHKYLSLSLPFSFFPVLGNWYPDLYQAGGIILPIFFSIPDTSRAQTSSHSSSIHLFIHYGFVGVSFVCPNHKEKKRAHTAKIQPERNILHVQQWATF